MRSNPTRHDERTYSITEFCVLEGMSRNAYFLLRKAGNGPRELRIPGSSIVRITPEARADWHRRFETPSKAMDAERKRRSAQGAKAGRASAPASRSKTGA